MTLHETVNKKLFGQVIAEALALINGDFEAGKFSEDVFKRWIKAIAKASVEFENNPFLTWDSDQNHLIIWSKSNEIYEANGTCQCKAFLGGNPCFHRALARLLQRYFERVH